MNGKLSSAMFGLLVATSLILVAHAIEVRELRDVLNDNLVDRLVEQCKLGMEGLLPNMIESAYIKIFRVYYDNPKMIKGVLKNYEAFVDTLEKPNHVDYSKELQAHSKGVCGALRSFFERLEESNYGSNSSMDKAEQSLRALDRLNQKLNRN